MLLGLNIFELTFPLTDPILRFLIILCIILFAPILLNKIRIPHLLGLIIAGALIGPNGLHLMNRDSSIIIPGTTGLLYIMFLAGLEIDLADFRKNASKSVVFGAYTFIIPMILGTLGGLYLMGFSLPTSVLLASMFASHTLLAYPLVSKLGVAKNRAATITVGGTVITDTLALLVLAIIVGMTNGAMGWQFWVKLSVSIIVFGAVVLVGFPVISRWFFKRFEENISQYIFVLVMMYLGAVLAELAGIEGIIGAFLAGLALNRLVPHTSPLMNRIEFVGNAIFIPFFLIGVGMLIDFRAFIKDWETIKVAVFMTVTANVAKYAAAWLTQQTFRFNLDERRLIFGLSNAQAAATLAAVLVGYNIVLGQTEKGEPIRLLSDAVLNGTILMILVTCTVASFVAQKGAKNIALQGQNEGSTETSEEPQERILIPLRNPETTDELVQISLAIKSKNNQRGLYALTVINSLEADETAERNARKVLEKAATVAAATDTYMNQLLRYDQNVSSGIAGIVREHKITDMVLGLHQKQALSDSFLGTLTEGILASNNVTTLICKTVQPSATIRRYLVIIPEKAEEEIGFTLWLNRIRSLGKNTGAKLIFYGSPEVLQYARDMQRQQMIDCDFATFTDWEDFLILSRDMKPDDGMIIVMSRKDHPSYNSSMEKIPHYLNKYFEQHNFILVFPVQSGVQEIGDANTTYPIVSTKPIEKIDKLGKSIRELFRKKRRK
jgi:Kef-type K+ transport system membrane component KefB/nucleotide-binding universal stress UspA family protein